MGSPVALEPPQPSCPFKPAASRQEEREEPQTHDATSKDVSPPQGQGTSLPPLKPLDLPKILLEHQFALPDQGWTTVTYDDPADDLYTSSEALFQASRAFFDLPDSYKERFLTERGSEEGWNRVEGEKEFITLRTIDKTPDELKDAATTYWRIAGKYLDQVLGLLAKSLALPPEALTAFSKPCIELSTQRTATMLRLFRYEGFEGRESKLVAEPHRDLGLLSLVVGDTPGLEVWNRYSQQWFQIERSYQRPAGSLLGGRQLERLSNGRYGSGPHQVRSYPDPPPEIQEPTESPTKNYRYSIVFVLRAHSPVPVDTDTLTTPITGKFQSPLRDIVAGDLFRDIRDSHYNINTGIEQRNMQRQKIAEKKRQGASITPQENGVENENP